MAPRRLLLLVTCAVSASTAAAPLAGSPPERDPAPAARVRAAPRASKLTLSCSAGWDETFAAPRERAFVVEAELEPSAGGDLWPAQGALRTYQNPRTRPYRPAAKGFRRFTGSYRENSAGFRLMSQGFELAGTWEREHDLALEATFTVNGRRYAAVCGKNQQYPQSAAMLFRTNPAVIGAIGDLREQLSGEYRILYGGVTIRGSRTEPRYEMALLKQRCSGPRAKGTGTGAPPVEPLATLRGDGRISLTDIQSGPRHRRLRALDLGPVQVELHGFVPRAPGPSAAAILADVRQRYRTAKTLRFRFDYYAGWFVKPRTAEGTLFWRPGAAVRADYTDGSYQLVTAQGLFEHRATRERPLPSIHLHALFGFIDDTFEATHALSRDSKAERCSDSFVIVATPRRKDPRLHDLRLVVDRTTRQLRSLQVRLHPQHGFVGFSLRDERREVPVAPGAFDPPAR